MGCTYKTMPLLFLIISYISITEGCNIRLQDFKYVPEPADFSGPNTRQCVPCVKSEDGRGQGSIWSDLYGGLAEDPSPRFGFDIGPIITPSPPTPCCPGTTGTTTTTTSAPTQAPVTRLQNATGMCCVRCSNIVVHYSQGVVRRGLTV